MPTLSAVAPIKAKPSGSEQAYMRFIFLLVRLRMQHDVRRVSSCGAESPSAFHGVWLTLAAKTTTCFGR